eukprot:9104840-Prorocentrum_lima.AAC.1
MTSSLVGSEMCIRDRPGSSASQQTKFEPYTTTTSSAATAGTTKDQGPVSYTHLTLPTICSV